MPSDSSVPHCSRQGCPDVVEWIVAAYQQGQLVGQVFSCHLDLPEGLGLLAGVGLETDDQDYFLVTWKRGHPLFAPAETASEDLRAPGLIEAITNGDAPQSLLCDNCGHHQYKHQSGNYVCCVPFCDCPCYWPAR